MPTPSLSPPLVTTGDIRLLVHENVVAALVAGFKIAKPELFSVGSFNVPKPFPPIDLPTPGGGNLQLDYRLELTDFGCDIVPADQTFDGFPDPFQLAANQVALYARIEVDLKGTLPVNWNDSLQLYTWLQCALAPSGSDLQFSIVSTQILIDGISSPSFYHIVDMLATAYLSNVVATVTFPLEIPIGAMGDIVLDAPSLHLDSIDCSGALH